MKKRFLKFLLLFFYILIAILLFVSVIGAKVIDWVMLHYGVTMEQIICTLVAPMKGAGNQVIYDGLVACIGSFVFFCGVMGAVIFMELYYRKKVKKTGAARKKLYIYRGVVCLTVLLLFLNTLHYADTSFGIRRYLARRNEKTNIYNDYYVSPGSVVIRSGAKPKNLLLIYLESMETTYASEEAGGIQESNYIPNLTALAQNNISFSDTRHLGGGKPLNGTTWTMGAIFSTFAGVPYTFMPEETVDIFAGFSEQIVTLGDVLEEQGYRQEFLCGSDAAFANRASFFKEHGDFTIFDYYTAIEKGYIPEDYYVWWGYEDAILYEIAKDELRRLAEEEEPFHLAMLTVDTHFPVGYVCELCRDEYESDSANVVACADRQIADFITWVQQQDFYEDTVIVIVGDHPRMDNALGVETVNYASRTVYNCFLNVETEGLSLKDTERIWSQIDMFPTVLSALGFEIEGEHLGLGTNLFSTEPTLGERLGFETVNDEVVKYSDYYISGFRNGDD